MAPTLPISVTDLVLPHFLELYEIDGAAIGAGNNGEVQLAVPREAVVSETGQILGKIAVKVLLKKGKKNPKGGELPSKLKREVQMMAMAQGHTNVAKFMGLFLADHPVYSGKSWFMAMEYYSGGDLFHRVAKSCLSERSSRLLMKAMLGALDHVHGLGMVHRDVKAQNILLTGAGTAVLADFGISCMADNKVELRKRSGSPGHMAPEMFTTSAHGKEVDLFALGIVLYFAVSGSLPFMGPTVPAIIRRTLSAPVDFTDSPKFEKVSSSCRDLIVGLTEKKVEARLTLSEASGHEWFTGAPATAKFVPPATPTTTGALPVGCSWSPACGRSTAIGTPVQTNEAPLKPIAPSKPGVLARFTSGARKVVSGSVQQMFKHLAAAAKEIVEPCSTAPAVLQSSQMWKDLVTAIVVSCGGALAVFFWAIVQAPKLFKSEVFRACWTFLLIKLRPTTYWWSMVLLAKGVWLALTLVLWSTGQDQTIWLSVGLVSYLAGSFALLPWRSLVASAVDIFMHLVLAVLCVLLLAFVDPNTINTISAARFFVALSAVALIFAALGMTSQLYTLAFPTSVDTYSEQANDLCLVLAELERPEVLRKVLQGLPTADALTLQTAKGLLMSEVFCEFSKEGRVVQRLVSRDKPLMPRAKQNSLDLLPVKSPSASFSRSSSTIAQALSQEFEMEADVAPIGLTSGLDDETEEEPTQSAESEGRVVTFNNVPEVQHLDSLDEKAAAVIGKVSVLQAPQHSPPPSPRFEDV